MENKRTGGSVSADFERKIGELQKIVERLESDTGVSLEESVKLFEDGLTLTKECVDRLDSMQSRIDDLDKQLDAVLRKPLFGDGNE